MEFIRKNIKWLVLLMCVVAGVGLFLPMCTVSIDLLGYNFSETLVFVEHDGLIVLVLLIISTFLILFNKDITAIVPLVLGTGITVYDSFNVINKFNETYLALEGVDLTFNIGFYLTIFGLIISLIGIFYNQFAIKRISIGKFFLVLIKTTFDKHGVINSVEGIMNKSKQQSSEKAREEYMAQNISVNSDVNQNDNVNSTVNNSYNNISNQQVMPAINPTVINNISTTQSDITNNYGNSNTNPQQMNVQSNIFNQSPVVNPIAAEQRKSVNSAPLTVMCPHCHSFISSNLDLCNQCGNKVK